MQVRLVDPQTLKVVRTFPDMTAALADSSSPPSAIWCECNTDEEAPAMAVQRMRSAQAIMEGIQAVAAAAGTKPAADMARLLMRVRPHLTARRVVLEWSLSNAVTEHSKAADSQKLRELQALMNDIDAALGR
jgi:hypothetical protein